MNKIDHTLYERQRTCLDCGNKWRSIVRLSSNTANLSGEATEYCTKCLSRNVMSEPARLIKKGWGSDEIPKEKWINPSKRYTCNGKRVVFLSVKLHNDAGDEVTYPVRGTVIVREKPLKTSYRIWSLDGRADVVFSKGHDLKEVV